MFMARSKYMTNRALFGEGPPDLGPVSYLTPSRKVVAAEWRILLIRLILLLPIAHGMRLTPRS